MPVTREKEFIGLIESSKALIHKICRMYRDKPEDREDLFQEIVFQLWKAYPDFKGMAKESTWLYRVALNTAMATFRKKMPDITYSDSLPDIPDEHRGQEEADREARLFAILQRLDEAEKALAALYLEDLSYRQIAEIMGISENYVGVKINRLKTKIQHELTKQNGI
ncbi:sigma-70 family RNA polymerase sigma factor [Mucilaginibacter limnophilus]|uniref:Sigma-70 family RNA polymerase sigma factor n=1 Tax=Mucilaginibacter limnophilus TaxID=1932778 RepID=A0A437MZS1_9SPHI|nr:sigma-70 family RNA polymerase sigma factor [Mucilaginibacter limnophilus]RVU03149.1 sigma-70 family RNA polymerase sigma factor [Mucilaginibacter limnophilus]